MCGRGGGGGGVMLRYVTVICADLTENYVMCNILPLERLGK